MSNPKELKISALLERLNYRHRRIVVTAGNKDRDRLFLIPVHRVGRNATVCRLIAERDEIVFRLTLRRIPTASNNAISDDPPYDTKGRVTPVKGRRPTIAPKIRIVCNAIQAVTPAARTRPNSSGERSAIRKPR